jgi:hypothetical protein
VEVSVALGGPGGVGARGPAPCPGPTGNSPSGAAGTTISMGIEVVIACVKVGIHISSANNPAMRIPWAINATTKLRRKVVFDAFIGVNGAARLLV